MAAVTTALCLLAGCGEPSRPTGAPSTTTSPPSTADCRDRAAGPTTFQYAGRPGTDPGLTSLDVYLPPGCGPAPVVVWVHGGR